MTSLQINSDFSEMFPHKMTAQQCIFKIMAQNYDNAPRGRRMEEEAENNIHGGV